MEDFFGRFRIQGKTFLFMMGINYFLYICTVFRAKMKRHLFFVLALCFCLIGCDHQTKDAELLHRSFYNSAWERFDYVRNEIEIKEATSFDLSMKISFTDEYPYDVFSMVFTVFDQDGEPYRSKGYKFKLKDAEGHWNSERVDGCYTFEMPINKALQITDAGKYCLQVENRMPKTPLVGVKELTIINN